LASFIVPNARRTSSRKVLGEMLEKSTSSVGLVAVSINLNDLFSLDEPDGIFPSPDENPE